MIRDCVKRSLLVHMQKKKKKHFPTNLLNSEHGRREWFVYEMYTTCCTPVSATGAVRGNGLIYRFVKRNNLHDSDNSPGSVSAGI